jgi:hypothetical protein
MSAMARQTKLLSRRPKRARSGLQRRALPPNAAGTTPAPARAAAIACWQKAEGTQTSSTCAKAPCHSARKVLQLPGPVADAVGHLEPAGRRARARQRHLVGIDMQQADGITPCHWPAVRRPARPCARHCRRGSLHRVRQPAAGQGAQRRAGRFADAALGPHVADHGDAERRWRLGQGCRRHRRGRVGAAHQVLAQAISHGRCRQGTQQVAGASRPGGRPAGTAALPAAAHRQGPGPRVRRRSVGGTGVGRRSRLAVHSGEHADSMPHSSPAWARNQSAKAWRCVPSTSGKATRRSSRERYSCSASRDSAGWPVVDRRGQAVDQEAHPSPGCESRAAAAPSRCRCGSAAARSRAAPCRRPAP